MYNCLQIVFLAQNVPLPVKGTFWVTNQKKIKKGQIRGPDWLLDDTFSFRNRKIII